MLKKLIKIYKAIKYTKTMDFHDIIHRNDSFAAPYDMMYEQKYPQSIKEELLKPDRKEFNELYKEIKREFIHKRKITYFDNKLYWDDTIQEYMLDDIVIPLYCASTINESDKLCKLLKILNKKIENLGKKEYNKKLKKIPDEFKLHLLGRGALLRNYITGRRARPIFCDPCDLNFVYYREGKRLTICNFPDEIILIINEFLNWVPGICWNTPNKRNCENCGFSFISRYSLGKYVSCSYECSEIIGRKRIMLYESKVFETIINNFYNVDFTKKEYIENVKRYSHIINKHEYTKEPIDWIFKKCMNCKIKFIDNKLKSHNVICSYDCLEELKRKRLKEYEDQGFDYLMKYFRKFQNIQHADDYLSTDCYLLCNEYANTPICRRACRLQESGDEIKYYEKYVYCIWEKDEYKYDYPSYKVYPRLYKRDFSINLHILITLRYCIEVVFIGKFNMPIYPYDRHPS